ncbi:hypothetical protein RNI52_06325 [Labrys neptuniae]|uniref:hypothetical protein n=1 Tax=Labrys neptuniae TaxID=376174 RepID=UPI0028915781|nr:hypothetical protein [Labrys neptuniae]MDT3376940.1 hypothetical protein [Labrys neptuniae]
MDDIVLARALHVLAVVHWIGGLAFVTLVVLPLARARLVGEEALSLFESVEQRFSAQVRISIPLAGATGLWMTYRLDLWQRFIEPEFWWMTAMFGLWLVFMLMLFVIEPLARTKFESRARQMPGPTLRRISRLHELLLALAFLTAFWAVAGAHGFIFF